MSGIVYKPCLADPDLWIKPEVRDDRVEYYSYILCYVDDILVVHHDYRPALDHIDQFMNLKEGSVGDPNIYFGAKLKRFKCPKIFGASSSAHPSTYRRMYKTFRIT